MPVFARCFCLGVCLTGIRLPAETPPSTSPIAVAPGVTETRLGAANDPIRVLAGFVSADQRHIASVVSRNGKQQVVVDGLPGPLFPGAVALDAQGNLAFSPDGARLAYAVMKHPTSEAEKNRVTGTGKWFVVVDGQPGPDYDIIAHNVVFSPDSKHVAYAAGTMKSSAEIEKAEGFFDFRIVLDGRELPVHESVSFSSPVFSADSQRLAYVAKQGRKSVVIVDGKAGPEYDKICMGRPVFSPDSKHIGYIARDAGQSFVVMDGVAGERFESIPENSLVFSPDSRRYAYAIKRELHAAPGQEPPPQSEAMRVVVDGQVGAEFDAVDAIEFSPDSRHVAYKARQEGYWRVVLDGEEGIEYPEIMAGWPIFSPDSTMLAYWMKTNEHKWTLYLTRFGLAEKNSTSDTSLACPCRGITGGQYDGIETNSLIFSANCKRVAFVANQGTGDKPHKIVVVDGGLGEAFDDVGGLVFSADGSRLAYWAIRGNTWFVMTDEGQCGPGWDAIKGGPVFFGQPSNPNGVQIAYATAKGDSRQLVVDGIPLAQDYDKIATGLAALGTDDGFETLAVRGKSLFRVAYRVDRTNASTAAPLVAEPPAVSLSELRELLKTGAVTLLDARPPAFYDEGHIPGALSFSRATFTAAYARYQADLEAARQHRIVVYCSSETCDDSTAVALSLLKLGYANVYVFRGGWAEWSAAHSTSGSAG